MKQCPWHILTSICSKGGLGRSPSKHKTKQPRTIRLDISAQNIEHQPRLRSKIIMKETFNDN
jgi:hypothetical protein